ncbi:MAG: 6-pyruvoyl-tetrahydropterin synthase-related protein [Candidatus Gracilibacteria bacterium]
MFFTFLSRYRVLLTLVIASLISAIPLLKEGFPIGHDLQLELVRLVEYKEALLSHGIPRMASDLYMGYGSPIFVFYAPLFLFLTTLVSFLQVDLITAVKIVVVMLGLGGAYGFYQFLKAFISKEFALIGALFLMFTPYKFVDLFSRNSFAEYSAFMLFPVVLWGLVRVIKHPGIKSYCMLFIFLLFFLLSHNITVMLGLPCLLVLGLLFFRNEYGTFKDRRLFEIALCVLCSFGTAMFFLLPAVFDGAYVRIGDLTLGKFVYERNFLELKNLLFDSKALIYISPIVLLLPIANIFTAVKEKAAYISNPSGLTAFVFSTISFCMMFPVSHVVWDMFPILHLVQFPWRLMLFFSVFALWNTTYIVEVFFKKYKKYASILMYGSICILAASHLLHYQHWDYYSEPISTPEQILREDKRTTVGDEYLNIHAEGSPTSVSTKDKDLKNAQTLTYQRCLTDTSMDSKVTFPLYYFPYWKAYVENVKVDIDTSRPFITVPLSKPGCVELRLEFTQYQRIGFLLSVISMTTFCLWIFYLSRKKYS